MQIYLVGGAVRDKLLDYPVIEQDWVVVGATPQQMLDQGYQQVGKDFPVFLHPQTHEEYALARTERKSGMGYHGFEIHTSPEITLEQDLIRRDLTINAIAMDSDGQIIDPYNGLSDIKNRVLRHISPAFSEDPLRVLRVARFAARYHHLGFTLAPETLALMRQLGESGELNHLAAERVWKETSRALTERNPQVFFTTLRASHALTYWFTELDVLWGVPNPPKWHPEIDTGVHTMMVLEQAALLSSSATTRFAAVCHDLGKGITPSDKLPSHYGHEKSGIPLIAKLCQRLKAPNEFKQLAQIASEFHLHLHKLDELKPQTIVKVIEQTDALRKKERFEAFLQVCEADFKGRTGFENRPYPQANKMRQALALCAQVTAKPFIEKGLEGPQIGQAMHSERVNKIKQWLHAAT
ncbi:multifunctional CCA addition/repair protein [Aliikangiella sp. IMCC44653]